MTGNNADEFANVEDPPIVQEITPLLEASIEWKKSLRKREEISLPWYMNRHVVLFVLGMSISLLLVGIMHHISGGYEGSGVNYVNSNFVSGSYGSVSEDGMNEYGGNNQYSNEQLVFESLAEDEHEMSKEKRSSNSSTYDISGDRSGKTERGEEKEKVYCDSNGQGPCIQELFGACAKYARCVPYNSPSPTLVPTSMPSTSSPTTLYRCDPNDPPCKVQSASGIGCAEHHTCLPSEYNTSIPTSYPTPMPSTADDCDPLHPPCKNYLLPSLLCYEYMDCHRPVNVSIYLSRVMQGEQVQQNTVNYDENAVGKEDEGSHDESPNKIFTSVPTYAPTPHGPCDPNDPETQPCRHALFGLCIERIECTGRNMTIQEKLQEPKNKLHMNGTTVGQENDGDDEDNEDDEVKVGARKR